jgi:class 3 adenylate cyclase/tetratricopeptide (TPR) repeat protein
MSGLEPAIFGLGSRENTSLLRRDLQNLMTLHNRPIAGIGGPYPGSRMITCATCGFQSEEGARFCPECGARLHGSSTSATRKVITALFCDVVGSTSLSEKLDPELLTRVLDAYFAYISATIERHGGVVEKFIGDAVMAAFGIPRAHEDDALRAVRAAADIRDGLPRVATEVGLALQFRTGVNTGWVMVTGGQSRTIGDAVNVAARLEQAAAPGEILIGSETLRLVRDAVEVEPVEPLKLKGKSDLMAAFRLVGVDPVAPGVARRLDVPLVGRERELLTMREAWNRTVGESACHLFTLLGPAGVGKSRLVAELLGGIGHKPVVLAGRCLHYGDGITFWPVIEALAPVSERIGPVLDRLKTGGVGAPEELFWEIRRALESLAAQQPLVLHIDDLQWGEPMLLDLLDHIVDLSRGAAMLLLCTARVELLEERSGWGGGKINSTTMLLEPLARAESEALVEHLEEAISADALARVVAASEGNPLFLIEMVTLARERGTVAVPPTIQAVLAARLEGLPDDERHVLQRAAIEGEVFHRGAILALAGEAPSGIDAQLAALVRKELIRPYPMTIGGDDAFRFRHALLRDSAYSGLSKEARGELHESVADWVMTAGDHTETDEIAAWHLEQATRYKRELRETVPAALTHRAASHMYTAGQRARNRNDVSAARNLLERAFALGPDDDILLGRISEALAGFLIEAGELVRADEMLRVAETRLPSDLLVALSRLHWLIRARPAEATDAVRSTLPGILDHFRQIDDHRGLAAGYIVGTLAYWITAKWTPAAEEARLAVEHARRAGDHGLLSRALGLYLGSLSYGQADSATVARELDAIDGEQLGPSVSARVDLGRAQLARLDGRFGDARSFITRAIESFRSLGIHELEALSEQDLGLTELSAACPSAGVEPLQRSDRIMAKLGNSALRSKTQALLSDCYERIGDREAAFAAIELAETLSAAQDTVTRAMTYPVRARLALLEGDHEAAERWARSAVELSLPTDYVVIQGNAALELAQVLRVVGRPDDAAMEAARALGLFRSKGDRPGADRAHSLLAQIGASVNYG